MCKSGFRVFLAFVLTVFVVPIASAQTWTNAGTQNIIVTTAWDTPGPRYCSPGQLLIFQIFDPITENDTLTPKSGAGTEYDDPEKEGNLEKSGTVGGPAWSENFTGACFKTYTVPATATAGQTVTIKLWIHDKRDPSDDRHDGWTVLKTWDFTVSTACPDDIVTDANDTDNGGRPAAGETFGRNRFTKKATGTAPMGRANWNGTIITETVGPLTATVAANFKDPWVGPFANSNDSSFTIGETGAGDNKFYDWCGWGGPQGGEAFSLKNGIDTATHTLTHTYKCSSTKSYPYKDTCTHDRKKDAPGERILLSWTMGAP